MTVNSAAHLYKVAVVRARWHADIVDHCVDSFVSRWIALAAHKSDIAIFDVPGALEITVFRVGDESDETDKPP